MASQRYLRQVAECIVNADEEAPGFWADLLVEVARLQGERRRKPATDPVVAEPGPSEGDPLTPPEQGDDAGDRTGATDQADEECTGAAEMAVDERAEGAPIERTPTPEDDPTPQTIVEGEPRDRGSPPTESARTSEPRPLSFEQRRPRPFPQGILDPPSEGCWRCGGPDHFRRECPRRREIPAIQVCYRCGRQGVTVRTCPECRAGWLAQGPYVPGRETERPAPPRRRGLPPPMRRREYGYTGEE